ncbi:hypothetical protein VT84_14085 [Gemmata sp. SH-PL17]|uniref:hypothetical protein n=1 Tax=Gemmata sp. SH-PL17 TaxID=1630693 RepID=UPI00078D6D0B|nr:hypothetical protein [Gemmata sp. SH-PL17]AMV25523.1 hypothetical protein VT84_14085 [Gemmata sp. SH-PL17]
MAHNNNDLLLNLNRLAGQQLGVLKTLTPLVGQILGQIKGLKGGNGGGPPAPRRPGSGGLFSQFQLVTKTIGRTIGAISAVVSGVVAAVTALPVSLATIVAVSKRFVAALNPYLVERYEQEQQNLRATIGFALVPVIKYATKSLRDWAGILLPSIQQLRPAVEAISAAVSGVALGAVRVLVRLVEGFAKVLTPLVTTIESNMHSWGALLEVIASVVDVVVQFGGALQIWVDLSKVYADSLRRLIIGIAVVSARLIGLFAGADAVKRFRESLEATIDSRKNPKRGLLAAPADAAISGIEDIARKMSERAFVATAGGEERKSDTELLEEIVAEVKKFDPENPWKGLKDVIASGVREGAWGTAKEGFAQSPAGQAISAVQSESANLWDQTKDAYREGRARFNRFTHSVLGGN